MSPSIWNLRRLGVRLLLSSALISPSERMIRTGLDGFGTLRRSARAVQRLLEVLLAFLGQ
jgi:hypothetical protein